MNKLWDYDDYVKHLSHENAIIRRWAFSALETRFGNKYTDAVSGLMDEADAYFVCSVFRYLQRHQAVGTCHPGKI
ncbi:MAG: hypothetical protein ACKVE4_02025 [Dissulfuribacterales bacterium]